MTGRGKTMPQETKDKISAKLKGRIPWNKGLKGDVIWNNGKQWPEEVKQNISEGMIRVWIQRNKSKKSQII